MDLDPDDRFPGRAHAATPGRYGIEADRRLERVRDVEQAVLTERGTGELQPDRQPVGPPHGTDSGGRPSRFDRDCAQVREYIASGSSVRSPSVNATVGEVGEASDIDSANALGEVLDDQRAYPLRLAVVGVVVARGQGEVPSMMRRLTSGPKPSPRVALVVLEQLVGAEARRP